MTFFSLSPQTNDSPIMTMFFGGYFQEIIKLVILVFYYFNNYITDDYSIKSKVLDVKII